MDKKTQTLIVVGLVAVGGYLWWKNRQGKNGTTTESSDNSSSAIGVGGFGGGGYVTVPNNQQNWMKMNKCKHRFTDGTGNTCCGGSDTWCIDNSAGGYGSTLSQARSRRG